MKNNPFRFAAAAFFGVLLSPFSLARDLGAAEVPFRLHGGHLIVATGSIGPLQDLNLIIDTGSSSSVISPQLAKKLSLKGRPKQVIALGKKVDIREVTLPELRIGDMVFEQAPAWVRSLADFEKKARSPIRIEALVGLDLLKRSNLTIDYESNKLIFGPISHCLSSMPFYPGLPFITVHLGVGERALRLLLDSGAGDVILFESRLQGRLRLPVSYETRALSFAGGQAQLKKHTLAGVSMGDTVWATFPVSVLEGPAHTAGIDGILGVSTLGLKRISFDFQNGILSWEK